MAPRRNLATILVAEADDETRAMLYDLLNYEGYSVLLADSGSAALARIALDPPDVVLVDLRLRDMDGYAVCRRIRSGNHRGLPILFMSAHRDSKSMQKAREAGATDYLSKPFTTTDLLGRLRPLLKR